MQDLKSSIKVRKNIRDSRNNSLFGKIERVSVYALLKPHDSTETKRQKPAPLSATTRYKKKGNL